jgi:L-ribulokinase
MFAATAAGIYKKVEDAMSAMGQGFDITYYPDKEKAAIYKKRFEKYNTLGRFAEGSIQQVELPTLAGQYH